jgi:selenocysteine lyase/cysteine desulfurase
VAIEPCHWSDGRTVDVVAVGEAARAVGAAYLVDVSQTLGAVPFPLAEARPDFVTGVLYKFVLGAYGTAFLWAAPQWRDGTPIERSWLQRDGSSNFSQLAQYTDAFRPGARRFDVGQVASHVNVASTLAAANLVAGWDSGAVIDHALSLTQYVAERTAELGFQAPPEEQRSPHIIGMQLPPDSPPPAELAAALAAEDVTVSIRGTALRVSVHAFNTVSDIDRLLSVLAR